MLFEPGTCRRCYGRLYQRLKQYGKRPDYVAKRKEHYSANRRAILNRLTYKLGKRKAWRFCERCGETFGPALDFHHRNPEDKVKQVSDMVNRRDIDVEREIAKCEVICATCHRKEHFGYQFLDLVELVESGQLI